MKEEAVIPGLTEVRVVELLVRLYTGEDYWHYYYAYMTRDLRFYYECSPPSREELVRVMGEYLASRSR